jgi:hypothetical protein
MTELNDKYLQLWVNFTNQLPNNNYIFEVTKCCNYSSFVLCGKTDSLLDLYKAVSKHFEGEIKQLFVVNNLTNEKMLIPITTNTTIREFILTHQTNYQYFTPIYNIPHPVVYCIYLDDGHVHIHHVHDEKTKNLFST